MTPKQESWDLEQKGEVVVVPKETPWPEKKKKNQCQVLKDLFVQLLEVTGIFCDCLESTDKKPAARKCQCAIE